MNYLKADFVMANPPFNVDEVDAKDQERLRLPLAYWASTRKRFQTAIISDFVFL
jgi:type I restriction-modification system DNA methylase subunit